MAKTSLWEETKLSLPRLRRVGLVAFAFLYAIFWWYSNHIVPHKIIETTVTRVESQVVQNYGETVRRFNVCIAATQQPMRLCMEIYDRDLPADVRYFRGQAVRAELAVGWRILFLYPYDYIVDLAPIPATIKQ